MLHLTVTPIIPSLRKIGSDDKLVLKKKPHNLNKNIQSALNFGGVFSKCFNINHISALWKKIEKRQDSLYFSLKI